MPTAVTVFIAFVIALALLLAILLGWAKIMAARHSPFQTLAENPELIQDKEGLTSLTEHMRKCEDCELLLREVLNSGRQFEGPVARVWEHPDFDELEGLRATAFDPTKDEPYNDAGWHLALCVDCRTIYLNPLP